MTGGAAHSERRSCACSGNRWLPSAWISLGDGSPGSVRHTRARTRGGGAGRGSVHSRAVEHALARLADTTAPRVRCALCSVLCAAHAREASPAPPRPEASPSPARMACGIPGRDRGACAGAAAAAPRRYCTGAWSPVPAGQTRKQHHIFMRVPDGAAESATRGRAGGGILFASKYRTRAWLSSLPF